MTEHSQFQLLRERRFAPFFWTQFFGAFNNNLLKNALVVMLTYQTARFAGESSAFSPIRPNFRARSKRARRIAS